MVTHDSRILFRLAEGRSRGGRELDGFLSSESNHLEARYCGIDSIRCYFLCMWKMQGSTICSCTICDCNFKVNATLMQIVQIAAAEMQVRDYMV